MPRILNIRLLESIYCFDLLRTQQLKTKEDLMLANRKF